MSVFDLPDRLSRKASPALIARDEAHFEAIAASIRESIADTARRLESTRGEQVRHGQAALDRDLEVHRLNARLGALRRYATDLCLGHILFEGDPEPVYIGRTGLLDADGTRLLVDWRTPAAEPFFAATHRDPRGLVRRRRYRWTGGRVTDYWDEAFTDEGIASDAALDDQSAFIVSLGARRTGRMHDVLSTIQADQDAVIRAGSRGALVVDGGPGTGKTVVALHRAAYLLYTDPRLGRGRGGVLVVGPSRPYLAYVADVLPALGEEGVQTCMLADLVPEGEDAAEESDPHVAELKSTRDLVDAVDRAVAYYERPPRTPTVVETAWAYVRLEPEDWAEAFDAPDPGSTHNEARAQVWERLLEILTDRLEGVAAPDRVRAGLARNVDLGAALNRAWPLLDPANVVADLWSAPAYLRRCAPGLTDDDVQTLQRRDGHAWTTSDVPLLDAARRRVGDPRRERERLRQDAEVAAERERFDQVVDDLVGADDDGEGVVTMLRLEDARTSLLDEGRLRRSDPDELAGPFGHIIVDEAQELTDAHWRMLISRCPSRSFTIVGDRAQARHGFDSTWPERLARAGFSRVEVATLTINYRTPEEIMEAAEPVIRAAIPDANVPVSVRRSGIPVHRGSAAERDEILAAWHVRADEGTACVIGDPTFSATTRVRSLTPELAKGLEFDLVVLVRPDAFGAGMTGAVDRYVSMTRATQQLVMLE